jgi:hypothetical protein
MNEPDGYINGRISKNNIGLQVPTDNGGAILMGISKARCDICDT